jgi:hypothetical protein
LLTNLTQASAAPPLGTLVDSSSALTRVARSFQQVVVKQQRKDKKDSTFGSQVSQHQKDTNSPAYHRNSGNISGFSGFSGLTNFTAPILIGMDGYDPRDITMADLKSSTPPSGETLNKYKASSTDSTPYKSDSESSTSSQFVRLTLAMCGCGKKNQMKRSRRPSTAGGYSRPEEAHTNEGLTSLGSGKYNAEENNENINENNENFHRNAIRNAIRNDNYANDNSANDSTNRPHRPSEASESSELRTLQVMRTTACTVRLRIQAATGDVVSCTKVEDGITKSAKTCMQEKGFEPVDEINVGRLYTGLWRKLRDSAMALGKELGKQLSMLAKQENNLQPRGGLDGGLDGAAAFGNINFDFASINSCWSNLQLGSFEHLLDRSFERTFDEPHQIDHHENDHDSDSSEFGSSLGSLGTLFQSRVLSKLSSNDVVLAIHARFGCVPGDAVESTVEYDTDVVAGARLKCDAKRSSVGSTVDFSQPDKLARNKLEKIIVARKWLLKRGIILNHCV